MEEKTKEELEAEITRAMLARLDDFKKQADELTLEGVRRALEKDLGMKEFLLDAHKKFIKQCLDKVFYGADDIPKDEDKVAEEPSKPEKEEIPGECEDLNPAKSPKNSSSDLNDNVEGSPASVGEGPFDGETEKRSVGPKNDTDISEDMIKKAIRKRAAYFKSNLQITLVKVRRLLEEDLKLEKNSLDPYKKVIGSEVDEILHTSGTVQDTNEAHKERNKSSINKERGKPSKAAKRGSNANDSDSSGSKDVSSGDEESDAEIRRPKKRPSQQVNRKGSKKQKTSKDKKTSGSRKTKPVESDLEKSGEGDGDGGKSSEDVCSQSSAEEDVKKKSKQPTQLYGKRVEHLNSIIKSCGLGVPPVVYKRVKQAPESKREGYLIKELEEILEKEGLSTNPSEKDIKSVKKKKERAKELEDEDKVAEEPSKPEKEEIPRECEDLNPAKSPKNSSSDLNENVEGSPASVEEGPFDGETEKRSVGPKNDTDISEDMIKKAIRKRAAYFKSNLQITLVKVRRLLEEDLKLEKNSLDPYKKVIGSEVDEILHTSGTVQDTKGTNKEHNKSSINKERGKPSKAAKRGSNDSDSSGSKDVSCGDEESDEEIRRPKKRPAQQVNRKDSKKQKTSKDKKTSGSRKTKPVESDPEKSGEGDGGKFSDDDRSQSSAEEDVKKKSKQPTQLYGKRVERLKSIIKSCGLGVPPVVYKRVKQAPESKRDGYLIKELEEILEKEGLSTNPSEKDIKSVKKKKERAKELEGIDTSNIVTSSRRRSTFSFIPPPPKPKPKVESDDEENGEEDDDNNEEQSDDGDNEGGDTSEGSDEEDAAEEESE